MGRQGRPGTREGCWPGCTRRRPSRPMGTTSTTWPRCSPSSSDSGRVAPGLLDAHRAGLEAIRAAYPWQPATFVSCHNDPNQQNLLFDGHRLWLVDWETASRSDPFIDVAIMAAHLAPTTELRELLLSSSLGRPPDALDQARLALMARVTQLYVGCALLVIAVDPATPTHTDLGSMGLDELRAAFARGELVGGTRRAPSPSPRRCSGCSWRARGTRPGRVAAGGHPRLTQGRRGP